MTAYQAHCERWKTGCGNTICGEASRVVQVRGSLPCDVLFLGESPGESEDAIGKPFCGPAGKLLDRIVYDATDGLDIVAADSGLRPLRIAFCNLVGCSILRQEGKKAGEPTDVEIRACRERLQSIYDMAKPRMVVTVGALARKWFPSSLGIDRCHETVASVNIDHPAYILRANYAQQGLLVKRAVATLKQAVEGLL